MAKLRLDEDEERYMRSVAIEIAHGGGRGLWRPDDVTDDEKQALAALGVTPAQMTKAVETREPPKPQPRRLKRYRDMDDDEFDDVWNPDRGSQTGLPF